jgi:hypothetical protein
VVLFLEGVRPEDIIGDFGPIRAGPLALLWMIWYFYKSSVIVFLFGQKCLFDLIGVSYEQESGFGPARSIPQPR